MSPSWHRWIRLTGGILTLTVMLAVGLGALLLLIERDWQSTFERLSSENPGVRVGAAERILWHPGDVAVEHIPALASATRDSVVSVRRMVVMSLGRFVVSDPLAFDAIVRCLDDPDEGVRHNSVLALASEPAVAARATARLKTRLSDTDPGVRYQTAITMALLDRSDRAVRAVLESGLTYDERDRFWRYACASTFAEYGDEAYEKAIRVVLQGTESRSPLERKYAVDALASFRRADQRVIEAIARAENDRAELVRRAARNVREVFGAVD